MPKEAAIKAVGIILSSYPSGNREGIENFYKMAVESLSEYPTEVLDRLCHPKTGIITTSSFIPSVAEMRKFCDRQWDMLSPRAVADNQDEVRQLYGPKSDPVHDAEHRAMMVQKFQDLIREISGKDKDPLMSKEEYQAKAEQKLATWAEEAKTKSPPKLSSAVLATLNLPKQG
jgi:hypothetical protein